MKGFVGLLSLCYLIWHSADAACANGCSGHGTCGQSNLCTCWTGWDGGAADCSFRVCPMGPAWADKPYLTDRAHLPATCSNAGLCNHQSGQCECFPGFTGNACQRSVCPNNCSGHGTCVSIGDVSYYYGADYVQLHRLQTDPWAGGDGKGVVYENWDKDSITMCECDASFFGADCSLQMCAKGDDPLTINQNYRQLKLSVKTTGTFVGDIGFEFQGVTTYIDLDAPSGPSCKRSVEASQHMGTLACFYTAVSATLREFLFVFYSWPMLSRSNNLFSHNGNPTKDQFHCDVSLVTGGTITCLFEDVQTDNVREWDYCSNRGLCDFSSGLCSCNPGYGGAACSNSTFFAGITGSNAAPGMQILVDGTDYTGDALQIRSAKSSASDFYLIEAIANNERMFFVRGDGAVGFTSLITPGGVTIGSGGMLIESGGVTIAAGGLQITNGGVNVPSGQSVLNCKVESGESSAVSIKADTSSSLPSQFSVLDLKTNSPSTHYVLSTKDRNDARLFTVNSLGLAKVHSGGLYVDGGISLNTGGLSVYGGLSVESGGLRVKKMGLTVTEGAIVAEQGIVVNTAGLQINTGGLKVMTAGADIISGGLRVHSGIAQIKAGMYVTGGLTVMAGGLKTTGGVTIMNNGLQVNAGGITVTGGLTLANSGLTLASTTFLGSSNAAYTTAGTQYLLTTTPSDRRLKERLATLNTGESLEKISKLKGVYYYWTKDAQDKQGFDHRRHFGFLAQDVQDALPEAVNSIHGEKHLGIDYPSIVPLVTAGVNDLASIAAQLQEELASIAKRLEVLEEAEQRRLSVGNAEQPQSERERSLEERLAALLARVEQLEKVRAK